MSLLSDEVIATIAVAVLGAVVLGWRTWGPGLQDADRQRECEDAARELFDARGRWPDQEPPEAP